MSVGPIDQQSAAQDADDTQAHHGPAVSILIIGYNTKDLLVDCLTGLFEHTEGLDYEVLFTDCSNDGSAQMLAERFPEVRVIENSENLGFGRGNNFLARHARGRYLLLLNPDTLINDNAIGELHEFARRTPDAGAWGGVTRLPDGSIDPGCRQAAPGLYSAFMQLIGLGSRVSPDVESNADQGTDVPSLSGAFMMVPRDLWQQLGGFDESFFMYCEETDLCFRIHQLGRGVLITPRASIVHLVGSGSSQSPKRMLALTRGRMHLTRKHFSSLHVAVEGMIRWLYSASRYVMGLLGRPLIGAARSAQLRARHAPILCCPRQWMRGWADSPATMDKPACSAS